MLLQRVPLVIATMALCGVVYLIVITHGSTTKLVYVDSGKLINGYQGMIDARAAYKAKAVSWKANIDTLSSEVQKSIFDYEKENARMTLKEKQLTEELIRTKQKQLYDYQQAMNAQAQQEDNKMTSEVVTQINAYLKKYGKEKGYNLIFAATDYGNIAYAAEGLDITDAVLEELNRQYQGK